MAKFRKRSSCPLPQIIQTLTLSDQGRDESGYFIIYHLIIYNPHVEPC